MLYRSRSRTVNDNNASANHNEEAKTISEAHSQLYIQVSFNLIMKSILAACLVFIDDSIILAIVCLVITLVYTLVVGIIRPIKAGLLTGSYIACEISYAILCIIMIVQTEENDLDVLVWCIPVCVLFVVIQGLVMVYMLWASKSDKIFEFQLVPQEHVADV